MTSTNSLHVETNATFMGDQDKKAIRCVQPFALREEAAALDVDFQTDSNIEFAIDELHRLHTLSIVDKHRRLPLLSWYLSINYWNDPECDWRYAQHPNAEFKDQAIIGYLKGSGPGSPAAEATFVFRVLPEYDPVFSIGPGFPRGLHKRTNALGMTTCATGLYRLHCRGRDSPPIMLVGG